MGSSIDIIGFLNADDVYFDEFTINKVVKIFEGEKSDSVYGDLIYVSKYNKKIKSIILPQKLD